MVIEPPEEDVELFDESHPCPDGVCTNAQSSQANTVTLLAGVARGTGSLASIRTELARVVAKTNSAFRVSQINARLSLMEVMTVNTDQNIQDAMLTDYGRL